MTLGSAFKLLAITALALGAMLPGVLLWQRIFATRVSEPLPEINGYVLEPHKAVPPLALVDDRGEPFAANDFAGAWSLLYFGYTYCPDACPLALLLLADVKKRLTQSAANIPVEYYLVSVDPERDTPARLHEYVQYFDPSFRAVTGPAAEIDKLTGAAGVLYSVPDHAPNDPYVVGHSSSIVLLDPEGAVHAVFSGPHTPDRIVSDFLTVVAHRAASR